MKKIFTFILASAASVNTLYAAGVYDLGWFNNPIKEHYFSISTKEELSGLAYVCNTLGKSFYRDTVVLLNDIDASEVPTISSFSGYLDGQHHELTNMNKNLFSSIPSDATIANLVTRGDISTTIVKFGVYAINCSGCIIGCTNYVNMSVSNSNEFSFVGAFCSTLNGGVIVNCNNYGSVRDDISGSSTTYVHRCGGIVGQANGGRLIHVNNYGTVKATGYSFVSCGGIVGDLQGSSVLNCNNYGTITSTISPGSEPSNNFVQNTGGIVGLAQGNSSVSMINACRNEGAVSCNCYLVAGIVGHAQHTHILNCINNGAITNTKYYYFACANGICSSYQGKQTYFANCINTGSIYSESNGYTATAGGTCSDITNAIVANLVNRGSVSAFTVKATKFQIDNYEASSSTVDYIASDVSSMNEYSVMQPYIEKKIQLMLWDELNDSVYLQPFNVSFVKPSYGHAALYFYSSQDVEQSYKLTYSSSPDDTVRTNVYENFALLDGLKPATDYSYTLKANYFYESLPDDGSFTTLPVEFNTIESMDEDKNLLLKTTVLADGVLINSYGYQYKTINEDQWTTVELKDSFAYAFVARPTAYAYIIKPYIHTIWGRTEGPTRMIEVPKITPDVSCSNIKVNSMQVTCHNYHAFDGYDWGITIHRNFMQNDSITMEATHDGVFEFKNLAPGSVYNVYYYLRTSDLYIKELLITQQLITEELEEPLYISPTAFMVKLAYANTSNYSVKFETRDLFADPLSASQTTMAEDLGNGEYYATLDITESGLTQYRYVINKKTYGEWHVVNNKDANCEKVPTLFLYVSAENASNTLKILCKKVRGELPAEEVGFQYKFDFQSSFYTMPLWNNVDLSIDLPNLVTGYNYIGKFYCTTEETTYYSDSFGFSTMGICDIATAIAQPNNNLQSNTAKILENGKIYIVKDGKKFTLMGQMVQ